jgi:hypothetical protein
VIATVVAITLAAPGPPAARAQSALPRPPRLLRGLHHGPVPRRTPRAIQETGRRSDADGSIVSGAQEHERVVSDKGVHSRSGVNWIAPALQLVYDRLGVGTLQIIVASSRVVKRSDMDGDPGPHGGLVARAAVDGVDQEDPAVAGEHFLHECFPFVGTLGRDQEERRERA